MLVEECFAQLDVIDADGNTPLHVAAHWGQCAVASYLLAKGAPPTTLNNVRAMAAEGLPARVCAHTRWLWVPARKCHRCAHCIETPLWVVLPGAEITAGSGG